MAEATKKNITDTNATPAPTRAPAASTAPKAPVTGIGTFSFDSTKEKKSTASINLSGFKGILINFVVPLICLGLTALVFVVFLYPSYKAIPNLKTQLGESRQLENQLRSKLDNLNRLVDFKAIIDEDSDLVNKVIVSESAVPALLTQVAVISTNAGLTIDRLNYSFGSEEPAEGITHDVVKVNLTVTGNSFQTLVFLKDIESAARLINIDSLRYSYGEVDGNPVMTSDFILSSPYLFVQSDAVTDEPVDLDISSPDFQALISKLKGLKYYDTSAIALEEAVEEETTPQP